jgi:hypothetical protein
MGKMLEKYNKMMSKQSTAVIPQQQKTSKKESSGDKLAQYRAALDDKDAQLELSFDYASPEGDLSVQDSNGVQIILRAADFEKDAPYYDEHIKDRFIGHLMVVKVAEIKDGVVYVRSAHSTGASTKGAIMKEIFTELGKGNKPPVMGRIIRSDNGKALVDICGVGIFGICQAKDWQKGYVRDLSQQCKTGQLFQFNVTRELPRKKGKDISFELDHEPYTTDPWAEIPKDLFEENAVIVVRCAEKPTGKSYWWGVSKRVPAIEVMGDFNHNLTVLAGASYKCKILKIEPAAHKFKVVPFAVAEEGIGTSDNIRFVTSKKPVK